MKLKENQMSVKKKFILSFSKETLYWSKVTVKYVCSYKSFLFQMSVKNPIFKKLLQFPQKYKRIYNTYNIKV